jgi:hypothetical protein
MNPSTLPIRLKANGHTSVQVRPDTARGIVCIRFPIKGRNAKARHKDHLDDYPGSDYLPAA